MGSEGTGFARLRSFFLSHLSSDQAQRHCTHIFSAAIISPAFVHLQMMFDISMEIV